MPIDFTLATGLLTNLVKSELQQVLTNTESVDVYKTHMWMDCSQLGLPAFILQWKKQTQSLCSFGLFICFTHCKCTQEKTRHKKEQGRSALTTEKSQ